MRDLQKKKYFNEDSQLLTHEIRKKKKYLIPSSSLHLIIQTSPGRQRRSMKRIHPTVAEVVASF